MRELLPGRLVILRGPIDDRAANEVIAMFLFLQDQGVAPIRLHLDSPGGSVASALAIRDVIDDLGIPVHTHALGEAHGVAALLLAHGARGHRTAHPQALVAFTPIAVADGNRAVQSELDRTTAILTAMLASDTGQTAPRIDIDLRAARRFTAEEARAYGLIDQVAASR